MTEHYQDGFNWSQRDYDDFSLKVQLLKHDYHHSSLFSDDALLDLLDHYPRNWLQCYTMGADPENHHEWTPVHIADCSGSEILKALKKGRLWINAIHIDRFKQAYGDLIDAIYQKIDRNCPNITHARKSFNALLISSPGVQVYYHLDPDPNMLWHLKGRKKVWVYPPRDDRFTPQHYVEEIIGEERHENLPYQSWFDEYAQSFVLQPGDLVSWPQHSPHRIENIDFNVSLTSSYGSRESRLLNGVHGANHHILKKWGINHRSSRTDGLMPAVKSFSYYALNRLRLLKKGARTKTYVSDLLVDPDSENGLSRMTQSCRTAFSFDSFEE